MHLRRLCGFLDALRKITTTNSSGAEARWQSSGHVELSSDPPAKLPPLNSTALIRGNRETHAPDSDERRGRRTLEGANFTCGFDGHFDRDAGEPSADCGGIGAAVDVRHLRTLGISAAGAAQRLHGARTSSTAAHHRNLSETRRDLRPQHESLGDEHSSGLRLRGAE